VSIWHGSADPTVKAMNAGEIVKQWADLHGLPAAPSASDVVGGYPRETWSSGGETLIESYTITGMAHGTPLSTRGEEGVGKEGPFLLEAGISSSARIAQFWGLIRSAHAWNRRPNGRALPSSAPSAPIPHPSAANDGMRPPRPDIGSIIAGALRSAGLIRD
jgi:feruloyl esterase